MMFSFPPVDFADETGLLAIGGRVDVQTLELAYRSGIFPWPLAGYPVLWFAPPARAILRFDEFHIPRRLKRDLKKSIFSFEVDTNFEAVIRACAQTQNRKGQKGTWITPEMIEGYVAFHEAGFAHSFETYDQEHQLVGGLYGVLIGKYFAGESMFYHKPNASKFALVHCVRYLQKRGLTWMDVQVISPFLKTFGAREIARDVFMEKLNEALQL